MVLEEWKRFIDEQKSTGNSVKIWYKLESPTMERVYLGPLKSYPHITTLTMDGDYPPEVTATALVGK